MEFMENIKNIFKKQEKINQYNKVGEKEGKWVTIKEDNSILEENYVNGSIKIYREYDENNQANGTWISYDICGERERISVYSHGKLIKEKIKEPETTEIGLVEYIYLSNGDIMKQYTLREHEFIRIVEEKDRYQDSYLYNDRRRIVQYRRHDEKNNLLIIGQFDEDLFNEKFEGLKQSGSWQYYDKLEKLVKKEYFEKGKSIDEYFKEKNKWNGI